MIEKDSWWKRKPYWLKGFIYGFISFITFYILLVLILWMIGGKDYMPNVLNIISENIGFSKFIFGILSLSVLFGLIGTLISGMIKNIKMKPKKTNPASLGGIIGILVIIIILFLNESLTKLFRNEPFMILPIENKFLKGAILLAISYGLGFLIGYILTKLKKK